MPARVQWSTLLNRLKLIRDGNERSKQRFALANDVILAMA
jgi:hypothetical protein